jgi:hypothetical protein
LQVNLDPEASLEETLKHPLLKGHPREKPSRAWAQGVLEEARQKFGENNFPDGRGVNFIIENNVINGNGKRGGGSLNLAGLQDSLIQNNLIYGNFNHGIALWDNGNPYDEASVKPGPSHPSEVTGPEVLSIWGCFNNVIRDNTVLMNNPGRSALLLNNGSWGNLVRNNILINDQQNSLEVSNTSIYRLDSGFNVLNTVQYVGISAHSIPYVVGAKSASNASPFKSSEMAPELKKLATNLDEANHSVTGITRERIAKEFVNYNEQPWVIVEGETWKLNPSRPDFHPRPDSQLLYGAGTKKQNSKTNLAGESRGRANIGAY